MPESYTGNEGTTAQGAGLDVMDGTEDRRDGWLAINKTRDYIVEFVATQVTAIKTWAEGLFLPKTDVYSGTGSVFNKVPRYDAAGRLIVASPNVLNQAASKQYVDNAVNGISSGVPASGGTFTGNVFFPNAAPATAGYAVAYINGDGRLSKNASSERYKKFISEIDPAALGDIWPALSRYQMRHGDGSWKVGYIAERLNEIDDQRPFVVYLTATEYDAETDTTTTRLVLDDDGNPVPDSIDFIALLMAQNAQLHQAVDLLAQRVEALEER